jgi:hypothetical protein
MGTLVDLSVEVKTAQAQAMATLLNGGKVILYAGAVPANITAPLVGGNTVLSDMPLAATAATSVTNGTIIFNVSGAVDSSNNNNGTPTFYRSYKSDGITAVSQGTVGTTGSGESMILADMTIVQGGTLSVSSWTHVV